uniref:Uncharacterized protein n=1 Tax=Anguilla anguilla TaxID=7936 RepID=A0A0E9TII2_ANGAN
MKHASHKTPVFYVFIQQQPTASYVACSIDILYTMTNINS